MGVVLRREDDTPLLAEAALSRRRLYLGRSGLSLSCLLSATLQEKLVRRFAERVMESAELPQQRRADVEQSPEFAVVGGDLRCTCRITGSTYITEWDGSEALAARLADEAADGTAFLITSTRYYAWLGSRVSPNTAE
jgi:hypothetical protein